MALVGSLLGSGPARRTLCLPFRSSVPCWKQLSASLSSAAAPAADDGEDEEREYPILNPPNLKRPYQGVPGVGVTDDTRLATIEMLAGLHTYPLSDDARGGGDSSGSSSRLEVAVDEQDGVQFWQYDLWGGTHPDNYKNALLSEEATDLMLELHELSPEKWTTQKLAAQFQVREQRVIAILTLKRLQQERDAHLASLAQELTAMDLPGLAQLAARHNKQTSFKTEADILSAERQRGGAGPSSISPQRPLRNPVSQLMHRLPEGMQPAQEAAWREWVHAEACERVHRAVAEEVWRCSRHVGVEERHLVSVPSFPRFEVLPVSAFHSFKENDIRRVNRLRCAHEDAQQIAHFKEALAYNTEATGTSIRRESAAHNPPGKPAGGWSIVVTPLDAGRERFVATPRGERRPLTKEEARFADRTPSHEALKPTSSFRGAAAKRYRSPALSRARRRRR